MKKLITLFLVLTGIVCSASAAKLWINIDNVSWWLNDSYQVDVYSWKEGGSNTGWGNHNYVSPTYLYGQRWFIYEVPEGYDHAIVRRGKAEGIGEQTFNIELPEGDASVTINDKYSWDSDESKNKYEYGYSAAAPTLAWGNLTFRQNIVDHKGDDGDTWDAWDNNYTTHPDGDTFTFVLTKSQIDASSNKGQGIRFRLRNGDYVKYDDAGTAVNAYPQIYPNSHEESSDGKLLSIAGSTTGYYQNTESTSWYWQINIPAYDYEKIVITAKYIYDSGYKWKVSADAYVTKTVNGTYEYATLACPVPLSIVDASSVVAYPLTADASTGKITKGSAITTIPANEGALLENKTGENQTVRAKVLASAGASASNDLHAFTDYGNKLTQPNDGHTYYILSVKDSFVAFYSVSDKGNEMLANTAYLDVYTSAGARESFWFDDDETATGIDKVAENKQATEYYNLSGQRVAQPVKGLYIVNGKKVIIK